MFRSQHKMRTLACALSVAALVATFSLTACAGGAAGGNGGTLGGKTSLTEAELGSTIATYSYNGQSVALTARDVIVETSSLDAMKNEDGTYQVPTADNVISVARNKIVSNEAEKRQISVSDEDLTAYAEETLGTSDFASIASSYSMDEDSVKTLLRESAQMSKLREEIVTEDAGEAPTSPTAPETAEGATDEQVDAAESEAKAEYAQYIIDLVGDEWDAANKKWASEDSDYATALPEFNGETASYNDANSVYYAAYQKYSTKQSEVSSQWTDFVNTLLANASISICTLVA